MPEIRAVRSFFAFLSSLFSEESRLEVERAAVEEAQHVVFVVEPESREAILPVSAVFPWRSLSSIFLALFAQLMLEPPGRRVEHEAAVGPRVADHPAVGVVVHARLVVVWCWNL